MTEPTGAERLASAVRYPRPSWWELAECAGHDPDVFFPSQGADTRAAKAVCRLCLVREDCLEFALANRERFGIWGGTSELQRKRLRRERGLKRRAAS